MMITLKEMEDSGACEKSIKRFRRIFGESLELTDESIQRVAPFFDWDCAATKLLTQDQVDIYERLVTPASVVFNRDGNFKTYLIAASKAWLTARRS